MIMQAGVPGPVHACERTRSRRRLQRRPERRPASASTHTLWHACALQEFYKHKFQPPHAPDTPKVGQEGSDDTPDSTSGAGVSRGHQDEQRHSRQHRDDSSAGYDEPSYDERPGQYNKGRGDAPYERKGHDSYYAPRGECCRCRACCPSVCVTS
jgi:hypothetical protein